MRTIAIVLCDNDFDNTFRPLLESIRRIIEWREKLSREEVEFIIRKNVMAHYIGYQYRGEFEWFKHYLEHTEEYLSKIKVLFDDEAEKHIAENDHDGGSWYLELQSGTVSAY